MTGLLRQFEVCARLDICDQTWMRWRKLKAQGADGYQCVPDPVKVPGVKRWKAEDIEALAQGEYRPIAQPRKYFTAHRRLAS